MNIDDLLNKLMAAKKKYGGQKKVLVKAEGEGDSEYIFYPASDVEEREIKAGFPHAILIIVRNEPIDIRTK
jgi:hypothetical protein